MSVNIRNSHRLASAVALIVAIVGFMGVFRLAWGRDAIADIDAQPGGWPGALCFVLASGVLHEMLHAVVLKFAGGIDWAALSLRWTWKKMGVIVQATAPVTAAVHRVSLLSPLLVLGLVPALVSIGTGRGLPLLWASFCALECYADLTELFATLRPP